MVRQRRHRPGHGWVWPTTYVTWDACAVVQLRAVVGQAPLTLIMTKSSDLYTMSDIEYYTYSKIKRRMGKKIINYLQIILKIIIFLKSANP